ncbi:MAG TPA: DNA-protecting protein DprA [Ruminococcaceae bacterium]|nr:DNA-protecting protein DprA [Oscillospiraceae bacterium]
MNDKIYWIWFQYCIGAGRCFDTIIDYFGSVEEFYKSNYLQRKCCPDLTDKMIERAETYTLDDAREIIERCDREGWKIITYDSDEYPKKLKNIYAPPCVLYVNGTLDGVDDMFTLGMVGTRNASPYALKGARVVAKGTARCGGMVISGGALGIDTASHNGALEQGGKTIAVLGCGLGVNYLMQNADLRRRIANNGALVTEYPPDVTASRFTFPARNRIISGLSDAVFVAEAGSKSGSLITANYAVDQNRDLYVLPASIFDKHFCGTNRLIEDGAGVVTSIKVLLSPYADKYVNLDMKKLADFEELLCDEYKEREIEFFDDEQLTLENIEEHRVNQKKIDDTALKITGDEKKVYDVLTDTFCDIDVISRKCSLDIKNVLMSLTMLELDGLAEAGIGKKYRLKQA